MPDYHILIGCTGSCAAMKVPQICNLFLACNKIDNSGNRVQHSSDLSARFIVHVIATENSLHFFDKSSFFHPNVPNDNTSLSATFKQPQFINSQIYSNTSNNHHDLFQIDGESSDHPILFTDHDEWNAWNKRGDPILHIDLRNWADILIVAPVDANTLAKIASGISDNLLTCVLRAWQLDPAEELSDSSIALTQWFFIIYFFLIESRDFVGHL